MVTTKKLHYRITGVAQHDQLPVIFITGIGTGTVCQGKQKNAQHLKKSKMLKYTANCQTLKSEEDILNRLNYLGQTDFVLMNISSRAKKLCILTQDKYWP
jgi:hypothetical protein